MRVALVVPGFLTSATDPFVPCWRHLAEDLGRHGEVTVFPLRRPAASAAPYVVAGARVIPLGAGDPPRHLSAGLWRRGWAAMAAAHRQHKFDVVHALSAGEAGWVAAVGARRLNVPLVVHIGGGELVGLPDVAYGSATVLTERLQVAVSLAAADVVTAGCQQSAAWARRHPARRWRGRVRLAPFGVDLERFRPGPWPTGACIVHVGDMNPVKDQATLLLAVAKVFDSEPQGVLHWVGGGRLWPRLATQAQRLGIADRIRWWGRVPHEAIHFAYRRGGTYVQSSRHEAQGVAVCEAAAAGLPIAATGVGLARDLPLQGVHRAPVADAEALAAAILAALDSRTREGARWALRRYARAHLGRDTATRAVLAAYRGAGVAVPGQGAVAEGS
ncbi:MAG: glycosyltransferase family 4 protein [Anaerolineae bacterium]